MGKNTKSTGPNPEIFKGQESIFNVLCEIAKGLRPLPHYVAVRSAAKDSCIINHITVEARTAHATITGHRVGRNEIETFSIAAPCSPTDVYNITELTLWK